MIFLKTFNNSAALVQDDQGQEQVVLGKGVGFGLKKGDKIDAVSYTHLTLPTT